MPSTVSRWLRLFKLHNKQKYKIEIVKKGHWETIDGLKINYLLINPNRLPPELKGKKF